MMPCPCRGDGGREKRIQRQTTIQQDIEFKIEMEHLFSQVMYNCIFVYSIKLKTKSINVHPHGVMQRTPFHYTLPGIPLSFGR